MERQGMLLNEAPTETLKDMTLWLSGAHGILLNCTICKVFEP